MRTAAVSRLAIIALLALPATVDNLYAATYYFDCEVWNDAHEVLIGAQAWQSADDSDCGGTLSAPQQHQIQ